MSRRPAPAAQCAVLLGMLGERIVARWLRETGHVVEESLDMFDSSKDLLCDGLPVEVKTQVPLISQDCFSVAVSQMPKIRAAHRVYWVSVPLASGLDELAGHVYEMDPADPLLKAHRWSTSAGREMVCFPRRQPALRHVYTLVDPDLLDQCRTLSTSVL